MIRPIALLALLLAPAILPADIKTSENRVCYDDICFTKTDKIGETQIPAHGVAKLYFWGFEVYTIALYMPEDIAPARVLEGDVPRKLDLRYHRGIDAKDIVKAKMKTLRDNPEIDLNAIRDKVDKMNGWYRDVEEGDRYELLYEPGKGTSLIFNGQVDGTIEGEEFAKAIFSIWLSTDHSLNEGLTEDLLQSYKTRN